MHCTAPKLPGHAQGHGPVWVSCDAGHGPRDRRDTSSGQNLKILAPALSLQGGGPSSSPSAARDPQCQLSQKEGAVLTACGGPRGRDGQGDTCSRQSRAAPRIEG